MNFVILNGMSMLWKRSDFEESIEQVDLRFDGFAIFI